MWFRKTRRRLLVLVLTGLGSFHACVAESEMTDIFINRPSVERFKQRVDFDQTLAREPQDRTALVTWPDVLTARRRNRRAA